MMKCLWCDKELNATEAKSRNLCFECEQISTGVPGLSAEQLDKLPFGVIEVDRSGKIITFNQAEERLSGHTRDKVIERNFFEVAPCADVKEFRGRFEGFLNGVELSERFNYIYYLGSRPVAVQITFLRVNQNLALVLSKRTGV